jgi:hypothetical protein
MKTNSRFNLRWVGLMLGLPCGMYAARATPDLLPPQRRQATVTTAERLAQRRLPPPLPADLTSPFNPPYFDRTEAEENASKAGSTPDPRTAPTAAPAPLGDRQILEVLAAQLTPTGTILIGGSPRLVMGSKRFEVGTRFTVTYNNEDYELELVTIDRTTFTLRYRGEEITRPIKSVR